jgi:cytochrome o ubiquinol oxidase subunit 1
MLWSLGFLITFVIGGMTGVLLAVPPADFVLHNSLFVVAHFHNVIIGGVVFALFAGITFWFPKAFGFQLDEMWGKYVFWLNLVGFYLTFMPLYVAGLMGMTRRLQHYEVAAWRPWLIAASIGVAVSAIAMICQFIQIYISIRDRDRLRDYTGDIWDGRTLEWSIASPPPVFNFASLPEVKEADSHWHSKKRSAEQKSGLEIQKYEAIEMPRNSATGVIIGLFATIGGFGFIWHIWWLVALALLCSYTGFVWFAWRDIDEISINSEEVESIDRKWRLARNRFLSKTPEPETL